MGVERVHYEALDNYRSYDFAWLGPIFYPLSLALIGQSLVYFDLLRSRRKSLQCLPSPISWLAGRCGLQVEGPPPDACVDTVVMCIMASETTFAVFCIVQCILNFSSRSFVGGSEACDFQAWYATNYTFSSMGLSAYGFWSTCYMVVSSAPNWIAICGLGLLIHLFSAIFASLPLAGVGSYLFAKDYCLHNVEGAFFAAVYLGWYACCVTTMVGAILKMRSVTKGSTEANAIHDTNTKGYLVKLLAAIACYFVAFAWSVSLVIVLVWLVQGEVYASSAWRLYGAQAIILHSNQLFVPLLFGCLWRYKMLGAASPSYTSSALAGSTVGMSA